MTNEEIMSRIQAGEVGLIDMLLEQNRGIIWRVAMRYRGLAEKNRGLDGEDLLQAGRLGMIEAIPVWDAERGSFLAVATLCMKRSIRDALGIASTKKLIENAAPPALLGMPVGEDEDSGTLQDLIVDPDAVDPQEAAVDVLMKEHTAHVVREAVARLPDNQRDVIRAVYFDRSTLQDIGTAQGISKERVRQIKQKGLRELGRNHLIYRLWQEYESAFYKHQTFAAWKYTNTSATEAAVMRREHIMERIAKEVYTGISIRGVYGG